MTLNSLVPTDQEPKLDLIHRAARVLQPVLRLKPVERPASDQQDIAALASTSERLWRIAANASGPGAAAVRRLSELLSQLAR
jgi:hypothetical protein